MTAEHSLHPGTAADLPEVMVTMGEAFDPAFGEAWTAAQCGSILGLSGVWLILARIADVPAGFALARVIADEAELLLLAVGPKHRQCGLGGALLENIRVVARERGAARVHLEMRDGNPAAGLYNRAGFIQSGRRRGYYLGKNGRLFDALTLSRGLNDSERA